jgi:hypothetical protein
VLRLRWFVVAVLVVFAVWAAVDVFVPRESKLRSFDPDEVARIETEMWRAYYLHQRVTLFRELAALMRNQYNMPYLRSMWVAYQAAGAAFQFQRGRNRSEYEKALPGLERYYAEIRKMGDIPFDPNRAAQLELEWWIIHRERTQHPVKDLQQALANLQAEIYRVPPDWLEEHARTRAEAMLYRDLKAERGDLKRNDWLQIQQRLRHSWKALWEAVNMVRL